MDRVARQWREDDFLTHLLIEYLRAERVARIIDMTATEVRRGLLNWDLLANKLGSSNVLRCLSHQYFGDDVLQPFGEFVRTELLSWGEDELRERCVHGAPLTDDLILCAHGEVVSATAEDQEYVGAATADGLPMAEPTARQTTSRDTGQAWRLHPLTCFMADLRDLLKDTALMGKILDALAAIARDPRPPQRAGQVEKLLGGPGLWSWHVSDAVRIVYQPDEKSRTVKLYQVGPETNNFYPNAKGRAKRG